MSFYPLFRAIVGGQNTAITLLFVVLGWRAALVRKDFLAGIILGLLLFKPQFGLPLIGLYVLSGRWLVGVGSLFAAIILYGIGTLISGPTWIASWYQFTIWIAQADAGINYDKAISWLGFVQAILGWKNHLALFIGWVMSVATAIIVALVWLIGRRRADLTAQLVDSYGGFSINTTTCKLLRYGSGSFYMLRNDWYEREKTVGPSRVRVDSWFQSAIERYIGL